MTWSSSAPHCGGFTGLLLGSTSQGLIQHAAYLVYVVPRKYVEAAESRLDTVPELARLMSSRSPWSPSAVSRRLPVPPRSRRSSSRSIRPSTPSTRPDSALMHAVARRTRCPAGMMCCAGARAGRGSMNSPVPLYDRGGAPRCLSGEPSHPCAPASPAHRCA